MADPDMPLITLRVVSPSPEVPPLLTLGDLPASMTVADLRRRIQASVVTRPTPDRMRLIYRGRALHDSTLPLLDIFGAAELRENPTQSLHLVIREADVPLPLPAPRAAPAPAPAPAVPNAIPTPTINPPLATNPFRDVPLPTHQAQQVPTIPLYQPPPPDEYFYPPTGIYDDQPADNPDDNLPGTSLPADLFANFPLFPNSAAVIDASLTASRLHADVPLSWLLPRLRDAVNDAGRLVSAVEHLLQILPDERIPPRWRLRRANDILSEITDITAVVDRTLGRRDIPDDVLTQQVQAVRDTALHLAGRAGDLTTQVIAQQIQHEVPLPDAGSNVFLFHDAEGALGFAYENNNRQIDPGPVHIEGFVDQFAQNQQLIAELGARIPCARLGPTPTQQLASAHSPAQNAPVDLAQNQDPALPAPPAEDRMANFMGHAWLVFKLACFVYIFAGGGSWYRPILLALAAAFVYLAQLGIFNEHFASIRAYFEGLLPNTERIIHGAPVPTQPSLGARPTPEEAARRIIRQHNAQRPGWAHETLRTLERSVTIFLASLWPGLGEQMVQAQEERERAARAAAEEEERRAAEAVVAAEGGKRDGEREGEGGTGSAGADAGAGGSGARTVETAA